MHFISLFLRVHAGRQPIIPGPPSVTGLISGSFPCSIVMTCSHLWSRVSAVAISVCGRPPPAGAGPELVSSSRVGVGAAERRGGPGPITTLLLSLPVSVCWTLLLNCWCEAPCLQWTKHLSLNISNNNSHNNNTSTKFLRNTPGVGKQQMPVAYRMVF